MRGRLNFEDVNLFVIESTSCNNLPNSIAVIRLRPDINSLLGTAGQLVQIKTGDIQT